MTVGDLSFYTPDKIGSVELQKQAVVHFQDSKLTVSGESIEKVELFDLSGKQINMNQSLTQGIYIVKILTSSETFICKILK